MIHGPGHFSHMNPAKLFTLQINNAYSVESRMPNRHMLSIAISVSASRSSYLYWANDWQNFRPFF